MNVFRLVVLSVAAVLVASGVGSGADAVSFRKDIAPILVSNCQPCHSMRKAESSYRADTFERAMSEGDSGSAGFAAGDLEESEAYRRMASDDDDERMPPNAGPLSKEQLKTIKQWIEQGAKFDGPDPKAQLVSIVPPPVHPDPPANYARAIPVTALTFSPDGKELFVGGYHEITVWDPKDGRLIRRIKNVDQRTYGLAFSPDGKTLAVAGGTPGSHGEVRLFDPVAGKLKSVVCATFDVIFDIAFSPQGKRLAVAAADNTASIYDVAGGKEQRVLKDHSGWVVAVAWSRDGSKLATASHDRTAKVFDLKSDNAPVTYSGHSNAVEGVAFHPNGEEVYTSGGDNRVHVWKIADGKKRADVGRTGGRCFKLAMYEDHFFVSSADKTVRQFEARSGKPVRTYSGHRDSVYVTAYHKQTHRLAGGGFDGQVCVWNTDDGKQLVSFAAAPGYKPAK